MRKAKLLTVSIVVALTLLLCYFPLKRILSADKAFAEITQAPVWADLQVIEYQHRNLKGLRMPMILRGADGADGNDVLGVIGGSGDNPYVWIVLNKNAGVNGIYAMPPDASFRVSCRYLGDLSSKEKIDGIVFNSLIEHCVD
ncbi:hypothetical protein [Luteibacter sp. CQ10]|uniref:hypothetical protein n=1 Tax=Luteibacter sp. CQ10 TaxID=2805821 RepID=UPI0034A47498